MTNTVVQDFKDTNKFSQVVRFKFVYILIQKSPSEQLWQVVFSMKKGKEANFRSNVHCTRFREIFDFQMPFLNLA